MVKKTVITSLFVMISASLFLFVSHTENKPRKKYEKFLLSEYEKVAKIESKNILEIPKFDRPDLARQQDFFACVDPALGRVPSERLYDAYKETEYWNKQNKDRGIVWQNVLSDMGGRTRSLLWDPHNTPNGNQKMWAGSVTGGLWTNENITDPESSWTAVNNFWDNLSVSSITYDPNSPDIMYVGTGEYETSVTTYRESTGRGFGIFKSTDAGETWSNLESTKDFTYISDLVVRNENGNSVVYAAVVSGVYQGITHQSRPTDGLYRSIDGGESWEQVLPVITGDTLPYTPTDIEIGIDGRLYVGTGRNQQGNGAAVVLYSDLGTEGSWTVFDEYAGIIAEDPTYNLPGRVKIAVAPSDENIVYALLSAGYYNSNRGFHYYYEAYLLKSTDKGQTWTEINMPSYPENWASLAWHAFEIAIDPHNPNQIFLGGLDLHKTLNGGGYWYHVSDWSLMYYGGGDEYTHADQHDIQYKPGSSTEAVFSTDGGVFYSANANTSSPVFSQMNHGYSSLQFYTCDINPQAGAEDYLGGLQDNGTLRFTGDDLDINDMVTGGDGAYCFYDKDQPNFYITSIYYNRYHIFEGNLEVNYFDCDNGIFINPADYDSKNNVLFANARKYTGQFNDKLMMVASLPYNYNISYIPLNTGGNSVFSHIKVSPLSQTNHSTVFVGTQDGRIFKVADVQNSPIVTEIGSSDLPVANVSCIDVGSSEDTLMATFSNYGVSSVWITFDGGSNWKNIEGNLPDMPVRWCIFHPDGSKLAMIATETGIWECKNTEANEIHWYPMLDGLARVRVDMLRLRKSDLTVLAASHGRGLFTTTWEYTFDTENHLKHSFSLYPNPCQDVLNLDFSNGFHTNLDYIIYDLSGKQIKSGTISTANQQIDVSSLRNGNYLLSVPRKAISRKIVVAK